MKCFGCFPAVWRVISWPDGGVWSPETGSFRMAILPDGLIFGVGIWIAFNLIVLIGCGMVCICRQSVQSVSLEFGRGQNWLETVSTLEDAVAFFGSGWRFSRRHQTANAMVVDRRKGIDDSFDDADVGSIHCLSSLLS